MVHHRSIQWDIQLRVVVTPTRHILLRRFLQHSNTSLRILLRRWDMQPILLHYHREVLPRFHMLTFLKVRILVRRRIIHRRGRTILLVQVLLLDLQTDGITIHHQIPTSSLLLDGLRKRSIPQIMIRHCAIPNLRRRRHPVGTRLMWCQVKMVNNLLLEVLLELPSLRERTEDRPILALIHHLLLRDIPTQCMVLILVHLLRLLMSIMPLVVTMVLRHVRHYHLLIIMVDRVVVVILEITTAQLSPHPRAVVLVAVAVDVMSITPIRALNQLCRQDRFMERTLLRLLLLIHYERATILTLQ